MQDKVDKLKELLYGEESCFPHIHLVLTSNAALYGDLRMLHEDIDTKFAEVAAKQLTKSVFLEEMRKLLTPDAAAFTRVRYSKNFNYSSMYDSYVTLYDAVIELLNETDKRKKKDQ